jgi:hypothetical protein
LTWPWAYDYLVSMLLGSILVFSPDASPMAVLAYLPLFFLLINTALFTLLLRETGLAKPFIVLALLAFALLPTTQNLHGIGVVDHHMAELAFVLATAWLGLKLFTDFSRRRLAVALGVTLGLAPAFHNSLFVLQIPLLFAVLICWTRGIGARRASHDLLGGSLLVATLAALLPSATFLAGRFEFATHSWFHLYVAASSAALVVACGRTRFSTRNALLIVLGAIVLSVPILLEIMKGAAFLAGETALLDHIVEVRSPLAMWMESGRLLDVSRYLSLLILVAPLLIVGSMFVLLRSRSPRDIFLMCVAAFGLSLLLTQFRLHPFGSWALPVLAFWFIQRAGQLKSWPQRWLTIGASALVAIAFQPPVMHQLFLQLPVGLTDRYEYSRPIYLALGELCAAEPGVVLAIPDDGHPIRYHSDCSVISNNFLLTRQHGEKALFATALLNTPAAEFREAAPLVKYILLRPENLWQESAGGLQPVPREAVLESSPRLVRDLFAGEMPEGFQILGEIPVNDDRGLAYARLVRVH